MSRELLLTHVVFSRLSARVLPGGDRRFLYAHAARIKRHSSNVGPESRVPHGVRVDRSMQLWESLSMS